MDSRNFVSTMLHALAIDNATPAKQGQRRPSIWVAFTEAVATTPALLQHGPVFLAFRERGMSGPEGDVFCRRTSIHSPPFTAWGLPFSVCAAGCSVDARQFCVRAEKDGSVRTNCLLCSWKSCKVRRADVSTIHPVAEGNETLFWHAFPIPAHVHNAFVTLTAQRRA